MTLKFSLNKTLIASLGKVTVLSKVISCSRAIVSSKTRLQLRKNNKFCHVHELGKYRLCNNVKEFEVGILFSVTRVQAY